MNNNIIFFTSKLNFLCKYRNLCFAKNIQFSTFKSSIGISKMSTDTGDCPATGTGAGTQSKSRGVCIKGSDVEIAEGSDHPTLYGTPPAKYLKTCGPTCKFVEEKVVAKAKWLALNEITFVDEKGRERKWESLSRTTRNEGTDVDAVAVLPVLKRVLKYNCMVLIKQYRPPMKAYTLEFPAGLVDKGETPEEAALRELKEETGYTAQIRHVSPATSLDPGSENCTLAIATAEIDGDAPENINPKQDLEDTESIQVVKVPVDDFLTVINDYAKAGVVIDSRVYSYGIAHEQATKIRELEKVGKK